jgi:hypothetical protein
VLQNAGEAHWDGDRRERVTLMLDLIHGAQYNPGPSAGSSGLREIRSRAPGGRSCERAPPTSRAVACSASYTPPSSALSRAR